MNRQQANTTELRIGLIGIGLDTYWPQFEGLEERLRSYLLTVEQKIAQPQRTIVNLGLVDNSQKSLAAGHACRQQDVDLLLVYATTYALSSTILPVIRLAKVPVILLNLQPTASIDYSALNRLRDRTAITGEWLAYCGACPVPEIANILRRLDIPFQQVTGTLESSDPVRVDLEQWLTAAGITKSMAHSRLGLMGHYYSGMLDIATDLVQVSGRLGTHIEIIEVDQLSAIRRSVTADQIATKLNDFDDFFAIDKDCSQPELERAAATAAALELLVEEQSLDMMAYYYMGSGIAENEDTMSSIILGASLLTGRGIPLAGEYEIKNALAMKILDLLGAGGSFTEYYTIDFKDDLVLMGHDGPGHIGIAQGKIRVRPLKIYHGKVGNGLSVEMTVKHGPVTLLSIMEDKRYGFSLLVAEGESVEGPILEIGNTNSRYRFSLGSRGFTEAWNACGPAHHCAIGVGHLGSQLRKIADLMNLAFHQVC